MVQLIKQIPKVIKRSNYYDYNHETDSHKSKGKLIFSTHRINLNKVNELISETDHEQSSAYVYDEDVAKVIVNGDYYGHEYYADDKESKVGASLVEFNRIYFILNIFNRFLSKYF